MSVNIKSVDTRGEVITGGVRVLPSMKRVRLLNGVVINFKFSCW